MRWIHCIALLLLFGCALQPVPEPKAPMAKPTGTIVAFGDSLTAGTGVAANDTYPAQLELLLKGNGYDYTVINMGRNGETTAGALSRVDEVIAQRPDIVILAIGANDALRLTDPGTTRGNIEGIVQRLQGENITVVMAGSPIIEVQGWPYPGEFSRIHGEIAARHNVTYMPFFLQDVAGVRSMNLPDGVHPNAKGYAVIAHNIYPYVVKAIDER